MKRLTVTLLLLILQTAAFAASPFPDGFLGIPWGSTKEVAKAAMLEKDGITLRRSNPKSDTLTFTGGVFGGEKVDTFQLIFNLNQLTKATVSIALPEKENWVDEEYTQWVDNYKDKYGGYTLAAREGDNSNAFTLWNFTASGKLITPLDMMGGNTPKDVSSITIYNESNFQKGVNGIPHIFIRYEYGVLFEKERLTKQQNSKDY